MPWPSLLSLGRLADLRDSRVNDMALRKALSSVSGDCMVKNLAAKAGDMSLIPGQEDPLEKEMANPLQYFSLGNPKDRGAWWATTVLGVTKNWTRLND